ncbi:coenzyme F420 hydrogenase [Aestuariivirga litoralis]|uniref:Coenzyme F420 hydrogenase n=1 Tax=Aestuariivirga litoralis TaxID=2650924 RepID=A0A2W2ANV9_9HYPH|nr:Coenzyme F420 hydrogenase/dehydrogenase, beta subunit C-terminal domain [Aestuariivirga litoralis]PZF75262.1 coenzyme F420 hydrogenase [Aestuariivirga litoralis]
MADQPNAGLRPVRIAGAVDAAREAHALMACPGAGSGPRPTPASPPPEGAPSSAEWGNVLEIWEGHATDPEMRWRGSSGGVVTALAAFAIDTGAAEGAVHIRQSERNALLNESVISRARDGLIAAAGSRYAPASPCERLAEVATADRPIVFIGKPCDVQATAAATHQDPRLSRNIGLTISIFCAGTPSTAGTRALTEALGVPSGATVTSLRYRGDGWPGRMAATYLTADGTAHTSGTLSYEEGWGGILQRHRQWRCHLCADHTGEFADLSVGDPWDKPRGGGDAQGSSLIVVRTERGRAMLRQAMAAGAISATRREFGALAAAQPNLARTRRIMFGRLAGLRILGLGAPRYDGWALAGLWLARASLRDKAGSLFGTMRRAIRRKLWRAETASAGPRR